MSESVLRNGYRLVSDVHALNKSNNCTLEGNHNHYESRARVCELTELNIGSYHTRDATHLTLRRLHRIGLENIIKQQKQ